MLGTFEYSLLAVGAMSLTEVGGLLHNVLICIVEYILRALNYTGGHIF